MKNDINHKNQILMNKLMSISLKRKNHSTTKPVRKLASLNHLNRKDEIKRISRENEAIAKRIFFKQPFISTKNIKDDYTNKHVKFKKRLVKFKNPASMRPMNQSPKSFLPPINTTIDKNHSQGKLDSGRKINKSKKARHHKTKSYSSLLKKSKSFRQIINDV